MKILDILHEMVMVVYFRLFYANGLRWAVDSKTGELCVITLLLSNLETFANVGKSGKQTNSSLNCY